MREKIAMFLKLVGLVFGCMYIATWNKVYGWTWVICFNSGLILWDIVNWIRESKEKKEIK